MKIVNAIWDEKVTGFRTCEICFEKNDTFHIYQKAKLAKEYDYCVVKIPSGNLSIVHQFEDSGFRYLETQLSLFFGVSQLEDISSRWERLSINVTYKEIKSFPGINNILKQVKEGIFSSDRYSMDPAIKEGSSAERYSNWIVDLFEKDDSSIYEMNKNGENIGFFVVKRGKDSVYSCPIAGIYSNKQSRGFIYPLVTFILQICLDEGAKGFETSISSHNQNLLSSFSKVFTYRVSKTNTVLRKIL